MRQKFSNDIEIREKKLSCILQLPTSMLHLFHDTSIFEIGSVQRKALIRK